MLSSSGSEQKENVESPFRKRQQEHWAKLDKLVEDVYAARRNLSNYQKINHPAPYGESLRRGLKDLEIVITEVLAITDISWKIQEDIRKMWSIDDPIDFSALQNILDQKQKALADLKESDFRERYEREKKRAIHKIDQIRKVDPVEANRCEVAFMQWRRDVQASEASKANVCALAVQLHKDFDECYLDSLNKAAREEVENTIKEASRINGELTKIAKFASEGAQLSRAKKIWELAANARVAFNAFDKDEEPTTLDEYQKGLAKILSPLNKYIEELVALQNPKKEKSFIFRLFDGASSNKPVAVVEEKGVELQSQPASSAPRVAPGRSSFG